eukprot:591889_1
MSPSQAIYYMCIGYNHRTFVQCNWVQNLYIYTYGLIDDLQMSNDGECLENKQNKTLTERIKDGRDRGYCNGLHESINQTQQDEDMPQQDRRRDGRCHNKRKGHCHNTIQREDLENKNKTE